MKEVKPDTIARTIVLVLALINQVLAIIGKGTIPIAEDTIYQVVSLIATIAAAVWSWWKNNSFTKAAIEGDKVKDRLKKERANHEL